MLPSQEAREAIREMPKAKMSKLIRAAVSQYVADNTPLPLKTSISLMSITNVSTVPAIGTA